VEEEEMEMEMVPPSEVGRGWESANLKASLWL
jgi:hypothetical protein